MAITADLNGTQKGKDSKARFGIQLFCSLITLYISPEDFYIIRPLLTGCRGLFQPLIAARRGSALTQWQGYSIKDTVRGQTGFHVEAIKSASACEVRRLIYEHGKLNSARFSKMIMARRFDHRALKWIAVAGRASPEYVGYFLGISRFSPSHWIRAGEDGRQNVRNVS